MKSKIYINKYTTDCILEKYARDESIQIFEKDVSIFHAFITDYGKKRHYDNFHS